MAHEVVQPRCAATVPSLQTVQAMPSGEQLLIGHWLQAREAAGSDTFADCNALPGAQASQLPRIELKNAVTGQSAITSIASVTEI